jgi:hypothetical protein
MKSKPLILFVVFVCTCTLPKVHANVTLFGYDFDDRAFADDASYVSGNISYWGFSKWGYAITGDHDIDLDTALAGNDLYTGIAGEEIEGLMHNYTVEVTFTDNFLYNGEGVDLIIFERGTQESMEVSLFNPVTAEWTSANAYAPLYVGSVPASVDIAGTVNVAEVDFSHWGLDPSVPITRIRISTEHWTGSSWISADISTVAGINSYVIPAPGALVLAGIGAFCVTWLKKKI